MAAVEVKGQKVSLEPRRSSPPLSTPEASKEAASAESSSSHVSSSPPISTAPAPAKLDDQSNNHQRGSSPGHNAERHNPPSPLPPAPPSLPKVERLQNSESNGTVFTEERLICVLVFPADKAKQPEEAFIRADGTRSEGEVQPSGSAAGRLLRGGVWSGAEDHLWGEEYQHLPLLEDSYTLCKYKNPKCYYISLKCRILSVPC